MITKDKLNEIISFYFENGKEKTLKVLNIKEASLDRYLYTYKKENTKQYENNKLFLKLKEKYSETELTAIANSATTKKESTFDILNLKGEQFKFGVISDTHIGSKFFHEHHLLTAFDQFSKEGVSFVAVCGDVTEGMSHRPGHIYELTHLGYAEQKEYAIELFKQFNTKYYMIDGNHDRWYIKSGNSGALIVKDICKSVPNAVFLGHDEGDIFLNGAKIKLWHGEDGSSYAVSYRIQKLIEAFQGGEKPNVLLAGHAHKYVKLFIRNVHAFGVGSIQMQSSFMRRTRKEAHTGFSIIELCVADKEVKWISEKFIPFYI